MNQNPTSHSSKLLQWLKFFIVVILTLGIFLRFTYLDKRVYWIDEVATSFRVSGYTLKDVTHKIYNDQIQEAKELLRYQKPNSEKRVNDTLKSLATEDSQHPPLYYLIAQIWTNLVGYSPQLMRGLSVLFSLLTFPLFYWLCLELFEYPIFGWIAIALTSVSFLHISYAQESREYSLWIVTLLLSSVTLLRAIKFGTPISFTLYTISTIAGLYTFPLTAIVLVGQGLYVIITEKFRLTKTVIHFLTASSIAVLAFLPWISIMSKNTARLSSTNTWMLAQHSIQDLLSIGLINLTDVFIGYPSKFSLFFILLLVYSLYFLCREAPQRIWLFILMLMIPIQISFAFSDLFFQTSLSFYSRYNWPCLLGSQLSLTYMIGTFLTKCNPQKRYFKVIGIIILILTILASSIKSTLSLTKYKDNQIYRAAEIINQSSRPLVINFIPSDNNESEKVSKMIDITDIGDIFSLSYLLQDRVKLLLLKQTNILHNIDQFDDVFILYVSYKPQEQPEKPEAIKQLLETNQQQDYKLSPIRLSEGENIILWKVKK
ncbi:MAG: glycosyltransferase family 39 protein [Snowella sp.]|nr:glycosyltransferase family 39 protein [Snowella sp.]